MHASTMGPERLSRLPGTNPEESVAKRQRTPVRIAVVDAVPCGPMQLVYRPRQSSRRRLGLFRENQRKTAKGSALRALLDEVARARQTRQRPMRS